MTADQPPDALELTRFLEILRESIGEFGEYWQGARHRNAANFPTHRRLEEWLHEFSTWAAMVREDRDNRVEE